MPIQELKGISLGTEPIEGLKSIKMGKEHPKEKL